MFDGLTGKLGDIFGRLRKRGALTEADVEAVLREIRIALLEADVALPVAKDFIAAVKPRAIGVEVLRSITPAQQVVKIVHDCLVELLGADQDGLDLQATPPVAVLMLGLQGSGKTTSTGKIAKRLTERERKKVLMASLDVRRPAAQDQLRILGEQIKVATLPIIAGQDPVTITRRALQTARLEGFDVVLLDSAGRTAIDEELMAELAAVKAAANPHESLLVADAMTGQDAAQVARRFHEAIGVTGIVLTRIDGDARGGAALSMRATTGQPIKFLGTGEKLDALEAFSAQRMAGRILDMGDVVGLVERAAEMIDKEEAEHMAERMQQGQFDLDDLRRQLEQMRKMGGLSGLMGMMPGVQKIKQQMQDAKVDDGMVRRQIAMIQSMTPGERRQPKILNAARKRRIAKGSGVDVADINRLLKQHLQMQDMMKKMKKMTKGGKMPKNLGNLFGGM